MRSMRLVVVLFVLGALSCLGGYAADGMAEFLSGKWVGSTSSRGKSREKLELVFDAKGNFVSGNLGDGITIQRVNITGASPLAFHAESVFNRLDIST